MNTENIIFYLLKINYLLLLVITNQHANAKSEHSTTAYYLPRNSKDETPGFLSLLPLGDLKQNPVGLYDNSRIVKIKYILFEWISFGFISTDQELFLGGGRGGCSIQGYWLQARKE